MSKSQLARERCPALALVPAVLLASFTLLYLQACARSPVAVQATKSPNPCGLSWNDWCPAPPGDPCGRHRGEPACRADPACYGMPYLGESVVACSVDARGFASNCPTVGCTSIPPKR